MKHSYYVFVLFTLLFIYSCKKGENVAPQLNELPETTKNEILVDTIFAPLLNPTITNRDMGIITIMSLKFIEDRKKLQEGKRNILINFGQVDSSWVNPCDSCGKLISGLMYTVFPYGMDKRGRQLQLWVGLTGLSGNRSLIAAALDYQDTLNAHKTKNNFFEATEPYTRHLTQLDSMCSGDPKKPGIWGYECHSFCQ